MTIVKSGYSGGSGNSVANYHWQVVVCDECNGEGEVYADTDELKEYVINQFYGEKGIFKKALQLWHLLRKTEMLPCRECGGKGKWERWY